MELPDDEDLDVVKFSLTFSLDEHGFFRRTCPNCGRDFKTETNAADLGTSLQPAFRRLGEEFGFEGSDGENQQVPEHLHCPYCKCYAESSDMLTSTFSSYFKRLIMRDYIMPMMNNLLSNTADSFGGKSGSGFMSFEISFEHNRSVLPPRPISGPEPADMTAVELLCCSRRIKIMDGWYDLDICPYCGIEVAIQ